MSLENQELKTISEDQLVPGRKQWEEKKRDGRIECDGEEGMKPRKGKLA